MRRGIEELEVYRLSMEIGEIVWNIVQKWEYFAKSAVGNNWVRAADSIALNISEGYGRHYYKENRQFCWIARGSLSETKTGLQKVINRKLISKEEEQLLVQKIEECYPKLNNYIAYIEKMMTAQEKG